MYCQTSSSVQSDKGKRAQVFAGVDPALVELPELGPLLARVPLAEGVAERQDALLGPCLVLVTTRATEGRVELVFVDRVEQRDRLESVAHAHGTRVGDATPVDGVLDLGDEKPSAELGDVVVAVLEDLGEVLTSVDVQDRKGQVLGGERLGGQVQQHGRVLAPREEQHRALALGHHLAQDEHGV